MTTTTRFKKASFEHLQSKLFKNAQDHNKIRFMNWLQYTGNIYRGNKTMVNNALKIVD